MTRTSWLTAAALLLALSAGPARCQEPASETKDCCDKDAPCCTKGNGEAPCGPKCTGTVSACPKCEKQGCKVADLLHQFQTLYKEGKYAEAEACAKAAFELSPDNPVTGAALKLAQLQKRQAEYQRLYSDMESRRAQRQAFAEQLQARFQAYVAGRGTLDFLQEALRFCEAAQASESQAAVNYATACNGPCSEARCGGSAACCPNCPGQQACCATADQGAAGCVKCGTDCHCCPKCSTSGALCSCGGTARCKCCPDCCEAAGGAKMTCPACPTGCCVKSCPSKKFHTVIVIPMPPLPGSPFPVPPVLPVGFAEPAPPAPPVYSCPVPAPAWQPAPAENIYFAEPSHPPCFANPVHMVPPPPVACSVAQPCRPAVCACCVKVSAEDGKTRLEVAGCGETSMTCESLVLKVSGSSPLKVTVADKQVQLSNAYLKATADSVARMGGDDCLVLEGNVRLDYHKDGKHTEAAADRVVIGLADGSLKIEPVATPDAKAAWHLLAPNAPVEQVFGFWLGSCH